jgi:hypothetical protein
MRKLGVIIGLCAVTALTAGTARAQAVGSYAGTQQNGQDINFTVTTDTNTGNPEITAVGFGIAATCTNGSTVNTGLGTGASTDIVDGKATIKFDNYEYYFVLAVKFGAGNTATGSLTVDLAALVASSGPPKKAVLCRTGKQSFTASLSSQDRPAAAPHIVIY